MSSEAPEGSEERAQARRVLLQLSARGLAMENVTEEQWLESVRGELAPEAWGDLEQVFARCHAVCWAGQEPTRWAVDETLELARALLERWKEPAREEVLA